MLSAVLDEKFVYDMKFESEMFPNLCSSSDEIFTIEIVLDMGENFSLELWLTCAQLDLLISGISVKQLLHMLGDLYYWASVLT
jgi:hypothetical protein